jgi:hypothetical protein
VFGRRPRVPVGLNLFRGCVEAVRNVGELQRGRLLYGLTMEALGIGLWRPIFLMICMNVVCSSVVLETDANK